jgi:hypothetical protein
VRHFEKAHERFKAFARANIDAAHARVTLHQRKDRGVRCAEAGEYSDLRDMPPAATEFSDRANVPGPPTSRT